MNNKEYPYFATEYKNCVKSRRKSNLFKKLAQISKSKKSGIISSELSYVSTENSCCKITAQGQCNDSHIIIPEYIGEKSVTSIGAYAFMGCDNLINVEIPESISSMGMLAFSRCTSLESIVIKNGLTLIEPYTFSGCSNLKRIFLPRSIMCIDHGAFYDCTSLTEIRFSDTKEEWFAIEKGINWNINTPDYIIFCLNGIIEH